MGVCGKPYLPNVVQLDYPKALHVHETEYIFHIPVTIQSVRKKKKKKSVGPLISVPAFGLGLPNI